MSNNELHTRQQAIEKIAAQVVLKTLKGFRRTEVMELEKGVSARGGEISVKRHASEIFNNGEEYKYDIVLEMKELASKGMTVEVVEEINAMDPNFYVQNPVLLFQLKQVEFLKLVSSGDHSGVLKVASSYLGSSAASDATLLKPLKETLLALLRPDEDALTKGVPLSLLATSLQVALGRRLGIEPQLMKIVRAAIHSHNEWLKFKSVKTASKDF